MKIKSIKVYDSLDIKLNIWDTAGDERFKIIRRNYFKDAHGVILIYDVTRPESFANLDSYLKDLAANCSKANCAKILIGNKLDNAVYYFEKPVSTLEAQEFASNHGMLFLETSMKSSSSFANEAFDMLIRRILETPGLWRMEGPIVTRFKERLV